MTTQALVQTIQLRREMPLEELSRLLLTFPQGGQPAGCASSVAASNEAFWTVFAFGSVQAAVLFGLIYAYFAL